MNCSMLSGRVKVGMVFAVGLFFVSPLIGYFFYALGFDSGIAFKAGSLFTLISVGAFGYYFYQAFLKGSPMEGSMDQVASVNQDIVSYIRNSRTAGQTDAQIRSALSAKGWPEIDIESAFGAIVEHVGASIESIKTLRKRIIVVLVASGIFSMYPGMLSFMAFDQEVTLVGIFLVFLMVVVPILICILSALALIVLHVSGYESARKIFSVIRFGIKWAAIALVGFFVVTSILDVMEFLTYQKNI